MKQIDMIITI